jgi:hypothetical protein
MGSKRVTWLGSAMVRAGDSGVFLVKNTYFPQLRGGEGDPTIRGLSSVRPYSTDGPGGGCPVI